MKEISTEDKARVFAMYLGQDCKDNYSECIRRLGMVSVSCLGLFSKESHKTGLPYVNRDFSEVQLILRPLSEITDEDAIEVAKMLGLSCGIVNRVPVEKYANLEVSDGAMSKKISFYDTEIGDVYFFDDREPGQPYVDHDKYTEVFQFLISKGYAMPLWIGMDHPLNGKTPIELGIAITPPNQPE